MAERPTGHQVPAGDEGGAASSPRPGGPPPPEPSHAERCRTLVASASRGALSTLAADPHGYPYGSVASYGLDDRGNPLFFVSLMAEHTQNAIRDPRASLLVTEPVPDGADPLASGRVTLLGLLSTVADDDRPTARDRYLEANPTAAYYIDFGDFTFYRLDVQSIRYVGGYGRMSWVDAAGVRRGGTRSARCGGGRDHRAHERRPRRGAGLVLPSPRRATRHHRGHDVGRRSLRLRDDRGEPCRVVPPSVSASRRSAPPATRSARRWSPWWPTPGPPQQSRGGSQPVRLRRSGGPEPAFGDGPDVREVSPCHRW